MLRQNLQKLRAIYRQGGEAALLRYLGAALLSSICDYQIQEVYLRVIRAQNPPVSGREKEAQRAIERVIVGPSAGIKEKLPDHIIFTHHTEVAV